MTLERSAAKGDALLPNGWVAIVKRDCPTCSLIEPVLRQLSAEGRLTVYSQDDPSFPRDVPVVDDRDLEISWHLKLTTVPTLLLVENGTEVARTEGWLRERWEAVTGIQGLGPGLPDHRPGCGSRSVEWGIEEELERRYGGRIFVSRRVEVAELEEDIEVMYERGWTDGLPVVPPTEDRVRRMLSGTGRDPSEIVGIVPPDLVECSVEKIAVNAVMAGCLPAYLPVVIAAVEAACADEFGLHGVLASTHASGPMVVVNGPIAKRLGMNSRVNALGQGNRANATIGRALQLVIRNVGGGRPGDVDQATMGNPGKYSFCFSEREDDSPFVPLAQARGVPAGRSAVTVIAGAGVQPVMDQLSRSPSSLARTYAECLRVNAHPKMVSLFDATLIVGYEHGRVFAEAGWDRRRLLAELETLLIVPASDLKRGAGGMAEGVSEAMEGRDLPKFRPDGLHVVHVGGDAGMFSAVVAGWAGGPVGSVPVTREVRHEETA